MNTYIALFRGINVGGKNKLPMRELKDVLAGLGLHDVKTYIQSGNVVFQSAHDDMVELAERMSAAISKSHGFAPNVLLLEVDEFENAVASNPFPEGKAEPKALHLYFLRAVPQGPDLAKLNEIKKASEQFHLDGQVFYLYTPDGFGRSKLAERVERALGVAATARNWRSVEKIMEMAQQSAP